VHWTEIADRRAGDVVILDVRGHLTLAEQEASLFRHVTQLMDDGERKFVLNLRHVSYIDSVGIGEIVRSYMHLTRHGGTLRLCNVGPRVREILEATHLDTVLELFAKEEDAVG
jgi:anti-sigma B factor antagonist